MGFFEIEPRRPLLVPTPRGVRIDASATKVGPVGPRGPQGVGADGAVQVAMSQQAGTAMRVGVNAGTVGLLVIADSKGFGVGLSSYADRWQDRLLGLLRARFPIAGGDTMRGLIPANMSDPYDAMSGRPTTTGTTYPVDTAGLGYNTLQLELGSVLTFPAATWPAGTHTLPIGYHTHSGASGDLEVLVDGVVQATIPCAGAGEGEPVRTSIPISAGTHTVSMRPKAGTAPVRVMYAEQRSASTGWHLYDASRPGLAARHIVAGPPGAPQGDESFAAAVAGLPSVRLAVVALGANDMTISTPAQYGSDVRGVVDMVKAGHPAAGVVVVLPAALTDDSAVVDDVQAYHTSARAALVDVPDLSILAETQLIDTTGPNAGAWLADTVHPNALGHDLISRALAGSLIGLDGPTDALSMVEAAVAPAVADAQAAADSSAQSAADAQTALQAQFMTQDEGVAALIETAAGPQTIGALTGRVTILEAKDYGVVGDGITDDTAAVRAVFRAAALWTSNAKTGQKAEIHFPAGEFVITANNVFADLTTASNVGLNVVGAGMSATRFKLVTGGQPIWFFDNAETRRWQYVTISDCAFLTDGDATTHTGGFAKITSTGHEQFFKFFRCHFIGPWDTLIQTEGTGNADQIGLFACKVQDVYGHVMFINNAQSVIHEWINVTATRLYGHGFTVGPSGGGDVKLIGGSWILMGLDGDTTPRYLFNLPNAGTGLGAGNGTFAAWGIKTETHRAHMRLVYTPDNSIVRVSFRDCNLWTTHATIPDATIEQVRIGRRGHVVFDACSLSPKFAARVIGPTVAQTTQDAETLLVITDCYVPTDLTDNITIVDQGRAIGTRLRGTDGTSPNRRAMDFDIGWQAGSVAGPSVAAKRSVLRSAGRGWPTPAGASEWVVKLPRQALITRIYAVRPGTGGTDTYELRIGSDDKTSILASSTGGGTLANATTIDVQPMVDVATSTQYRTLRLWAQGTATAPGAGGISAWIEYM